MKAALTVSTPSVLRLNRCQGWLNRDRRLIGVEVRTCSFYELHDGSWGQYTAPGLWVSGLMNNPRSSSERQKSFAAAHLAWLRGWLYCIVWPVNDSSRPYSGMEAVSQPKSQDPRPK